MRLRQTEFVLFESKGGVDDKVKIHVKVSLDHNNLSVELNGQPKKWYNKTLKMIEERRFSNPFSYTPESKPDWKIEVGVDQQKKTFILWINGTDFLSLKPYVEGRSMSDAPVARSEVIVNMEESPYRAPSQGQQGATSQKAQEDAPVQANVEVVKEEAPEEAEKEEEVPAEDDDKSSNNEDNITHDQVPSFEQAETNTR